MLSIGPKSLYFATPLVFNSPDGGVPLERSRKIFRGCQWMAKVPNAVEKLPKITTAWVGCTSVRDDRLQTDRQTDIQTDDRRTATAYSERELTFTFAKNWLAFGKVRGKSRMALFPDTVYYSYFNISSCYFDVIQDGADWSSWSSYLLRCRFTYEISRLCNTQPQCTASLSTTLMVPVEQ